VSIGAYLGRFGKEHSELEEDEEHQKWIKQVKRAMLDAIEKQTGIKREWSEGVEPEQQIGQELGSWSNLLQLQRYAAHMHFTGRPPESPAGDDDLDDDEYLIRYRQATEDDSTWEYKNLAFRHLIVTGDEMWFVPIDFPDPLLIEENDKEDSISVGSSYRLISELDTINKALLMIGDYGQFGEEEAWKVYENEEDPWRFVKWSWIVLHWLARESVNRKLCIYLE
jgi:hypothetical protein